MWHGTPKPAGKDIIMNGFKPSTGGAQGPGVYMAKRIEVT